MLIAEINSVVEKYQKNAFTGHIKFGIENAKIVSFTEISKVEESFRNSADFARQLVEICNDMIFGSIEFDLILGKIERLNYCKSYNGEILKKKLGKI